MKPGEARVLAVNGGSSSIRFALFRAGAGLERGLHGKIERIGQEGTTLEARDPAMDRQERLPLETGDHGSAARQLIDWLEAQEEFPSVHAVGHRVVHGMRHASPERVTPEMLDELRRGIPFDPEHLPREIELIAAFRDRHPRLPQVACFDTTFHREMPRVATMLALPRRYEAMGVRRYGFHGLSYAFLMEELARLGDPAATAGRVILAHLGNGASMAAVRDGRSVDTSMGFTPASGLVMSTRSGDLDPGVAPYLARTEGLAAEQFYRMASHESGMLGISETTGDMRDLLEKAPSDARAAEAVALFCYQARKCIGSFAAVLGGLETLVFAGGIGENDPRVRERICDGLGFLGIQLDPARNAANGPLVSSDASRVPVRVIRTDEELMIARSAAKLLAPDSIQED